MVQDQEEPFSLKPSVVSSVLSGPSDAVCVDCKVTLKGIPCYKIERSQGEKDVFLCPGHHYLRQEERQTAQGKGVEYIARPFGTLPMPASTTNENPDDRRERFFLESVAEPGSIQQPRSGGFMAEARSFFELLREKIRRFRGRI